MNPAPTVTPTTRQPFLDWLRVIAFAVLVPYHVGMYYVPWDFHVKSPFAGPGLEPWMMLSSPWRLSLLFIVSGAATSLMLRKGAGFGFLRARSKRLLLPLLFGMAVIVTPQPYFEVVQKYGYSGGYLDFLGLYFTGYHGFCGTGARAAQCLMLPTWNHLWFLPYLWLYTALLWAALAVSPSLLDRLAALATRWLRGAGLMLIPIAAIVLFRATLQGRFTSTHAMMGDWFNHVMYAGMFIAGAVFARAAELWERLAALRWPALLLALGSWAIGWAWIVNFGAGFPLPARVLMISALQWGALVAAIGFARQHLNVDHRWRRRLAEAVFPVYILHQTVIIVASQWLLPLRWRPALEGPVLIALTFIVSWVGYEAVRRVGWLRPWFGLSPTAVSPASASDRTVPA